MNSNSAPSGVKYAEDWLPIKSINNGMILTEDGYYVTGVKVSPKNIFILDEQSQNATLFKLSTFYNTLDFDFWLLVSDRPVDISLYLNELQVEYNKNPNINLSLLILLFLITNVVLPGIILPSKSINASNRFNPFIIILLQFTIVEYLFLNLR